MTEEDQSAELLRRYYRANTAVIRQAQEMAVMADRASRSMLKTLNTSPMRETVAALGEANARLTAVDLFPAVDTARALERNRSVIGEAGRAGAAAAPVAAEAMTAVNRSGAARFYATSPATAFFTARGASMLGAGRVAWPTSSELDVMGRAHRDVTRALSGMSGTWHRGLLSSQMTIAQKFTTPVVPGSLLSPWGPAGRFDWSVVTTAAKTAGELHRLLRSWQALIFSAADSAVSHLARTGYLAAMGARHAAVHGDMETVADFIRDWLQLKPTEERVEAVAAALLEQTWESVPSTALWTIKTRSGDQRHVLRPIWDTELNGQPVGMFEEPLRSGGTLGDLATDRSAEAIALEPFMERPIQVVLDRLNPAERAVVEAKAFYNLDWYQAAEEAGQTREFGRRVNRKLKRLGDLYTERHGDYRL